MYVQGPEAVINAITNVLFTGWLQGSKQADFTRLFVRGEIVVLFAELFLFALFLRGKDDKRCAPKSLNYAVVANLASAIATFILL